MFPFNLKNFFLPTRNQDTIKPKGGITSQTSKILVPDSRNFLTFNQNPDELFQRKQSFEIYREMGETDYLIKALLDLRKRLILGSGWEIEDPVDENGEPMEELSHITKFVDHSLRDSLNGDLFQYIYEILSAIDFGYSVTELIYKIEDGKVLLKKFKTVPPESIEFEMDEFGELKNNGITQFTFQGNVSLDQEKFVLFSWNMQESNPYGRSDLRAAYTPFFIKKNVQKFRAKYLEKFGSPLVLAKYPSNVTDPEEAQSIQDIVTNIQNSSSAVIPEDVMLEIKETAQKGADSYSRALEDYDQQITTALMTPDLVGFTRIKIGSFSLGKEQQKIYLALIRSYRILIEEQVMNEQVIKRLVDLNFSGTKKYPKFKFKQLIEQDEIERVKVFLEAFKTRSFQPNETDIAFIKEKLGVPLSGIEVLPINQQPDEPETPEQEPTDDDFPEVEEVDDIPDDIENTEPVEDLKRKGVKPKSFANKFETREKFVFMDNEIDFQKMDDEFNAKTEKTTNKISSIVESIKKDVLDFIVKEQIIEKEKIEKIPRIAIRQTGNIKTQYERLFNSMTNMGASDLQKETKAQNQDFAVLNDLDMTLSEAKIFLAQLSLTKAVQLAGDMSNRFKREISIILLEGLRLGKTTNEMITELEQVFDPYIKGAVIPGSSVKPFRLENIVRTNANSFYNQGRVAGSKAAVRAGLITHYQYSAIIDDRTSDICRELHGTVVPATDVDTLSTITPPRHFNCRSILIPVTKFRQDEMQEGIQDGELKPGLRKPNDFYDGFRSPTKLKPEK